MVDLSSVWLAWVATGAAGVMSMVMSALAARDLMLSERLLPAEWPARAGRCDQA